VATAKALDSQADWELSQDGAMIFRGRLAWIGSEKDRHMSAHQRGRVL